MRRTSSAAIAAALLAAAPFLAAPSKPAGPLDLSPASLLAAMQAAGKPELSLRALGIAENGDPVTTRKAIQSVIDALAQPGLPAGMPTLRGDGQWKIDRGLYFEAPLHVTGGNFATPYPIQRDAAILGIPRAPQGQSLTPAHRFPLAGKLDASAGPRRGFRTLGDSHVAQWAGPLAWGLSGADDGFTVLLAIDYGTTPHGTAALAGISEASQPQPVRVQELAGRAVCEYRLSDGSTRSIAFPIPPTPTVHHLAFSIDLRAGRAIAFCDKVQVAADQPKGTPPAGSKLAENPGLPFKLGAEGGGANTFPSDARSGLVVDISYCGLRIDRGATLADDGPGKPLRFLDGSTVADALYFTTRPATVGLLQLAEDVEDSLANRYLDVAGSGVATSCFVASPGHSSPASARGGQWFEDVEFRSGSSASPFGSAVTLGYVVDNARWDRCNAFGGAYGVSSPGWGYSYVLRFRDGHFGGMLSAVRLVQDTVIMDDCRFDFHGLLGTIALKWSNLQGSNLWMSYGGTPRRIVHVVGSIFKATNVSADIESGDYPSECAILVETDSGQGGPFGAWLEIDRFSIGHLDGKPLVKVHNRPGAPPATLRLKDPEAQSGTPSAIVAADGPVNGYVDNLIPTRAPTFPGPAPAGLLDRNAAAPIAAGDAPPPAAPTRGLDALDLASQLKAIRDQAEALRGQLDADQAGARIGADLDAVAAAIADAIANIRTPLRAEVKLADGTVWSFDESTGSELGDLAGPGFVQRCIRSTLPNVPLDVDFRPDREGGREEVILQLGRLWGDANAAAANLGPYTLSIYRGDQVIHTESVPSHNWFGRWRWQSAARPAVRAPAEVLALAKLPPLDPDLTAQCPPGPAVGEHGVAVAYAGPMATAGLWTGMGAPADRSDIGPITEYQGQWLATGDATAYTRMIAQAEASGSVDWHFRDEVTGRFVSVRDHPKVSINDTPIKGLEWIKRADSSATGWQIDNAHHPALAYIPYLATGDPYYLEELQAVASWCLAWDHRNRGADFSKAVVSSQQVRGLAWSLRTVAQAAEATPDDAPAWLLPADYWAGALDDNRDWLTANFVDNPDPRASVFRATDWTKVDPWMEDYLTFTLGWMVRLGRDDWLPVLTWKAGARMALCGANGSGWPIEFCCPYTYPLGSASGPAPYASWAEMFAAWPATATPRGFDPGLPTRPVPAGLLYQKFWGYHEYAQGALSSIAPYVPGASGYRDAIKAMAAKGPTGNGRVPSPPSFRWSFAPGPPAQ